MRPRGQTNNQTVKLRAEKELNSAYREMTDSDTEMGTETDLHAERYSRAGRTHTDTANRGLQAQRYKQRQTQTDIDKQ